MGMTALDRAPARMLVAVLALGALSLSTRAAAQPVFDHMKCYKVRDDEASRAWTADLAPKLTHDFQLEQGDEIIGGSLVKGCRIKVPAKYYCIDVETQDTKQVAPPYNPSQWTVEGPESGERLCYKLSCPKVLPKTLSVIDQFGTRDITLLGVAQWLCTPVVRQNPSTDPCEMDGAGQCGGTCPEGESCLAISGEDCGCVPSEQHCAQTSGACSAGFCGGVWETCISFGGICGCSHP
jgi:hypothetical protein